MKVISIATLSTTALTQCGKAWHKRCPPQHQLVDYADGIVTLHNMLRNTLTDELALKSPERMATLQWDQELAKKTEENIRQCQAQTDNCHGMERFPNATQNVGVLQSIFWDPYVHAELIIKEWWSGQKFVTRAILEKYPHVASATPYSNFTVMVVLWQLMAWKGIIIFLLTCNYAFDNVAGERTYEGGAPGWGCTTGHNEIFKNLCSIHEKYD